MTGSVIKTGDMFATDIKVLDVTTKALLKSVQAQGEGEDSILRNQIDDLSEEITRGLGIVSAPFDQAAFDCGSDHYFPGVLQILP